MPKYWLDHIHLNSFDPLKTAGFYEKTLGAKRQSERKLPDGRTLVVIKLNDTVINITSPRLKPLRPGIPLTEDGLEHFSLATDNIQEAVSELKANGTEFLTEVASLGTIQFAFFLGPDRVLTELLQRGETK